MKFKLLLTIMAIFTLLESSLTDEFKSNKTLNDSLIFNKVLRFSKRSLRGIGYQRCHPVPRTQGRTACTSTSLGPKLVPVQES